MTPQELLLGGGFAPSSIFSYLENEGTNDMTDLFVKVGEKSQRKIAYPMHESWVDVGRPEDYKSAASHFE